MVAVAAHRRVRNVILASAGAAGVAAGPMVIIIVLVDGFFPLIGIALMSGVLISLVVALVTWVVMKLTGKLPKELP